MERNDTARLVRLVRLEQARNDLPTDSLFHAGPPYQGAPPQAVLAAAAQAAVIGGMAADIGQARGMIADQAIRLRPAQDHGLVTPLAQVVAPSMWCVEVGAGRRLAYAPVSEGPAPALRFGSDDPACIARSRDWCARAAAGINLALSESGAEVAPESLMRAALQAGDDCHARTIAGNELFLACLPDLDPALRGDILANPGFVLPIWMAWGSWKMQDSRSRISAMGGNGLAFGLRLRGQRTWKTVPASSATGKLFAPDKAGQALGAIGDSAVIDACGFGGQALRHAPSLVEEWSVALPSDALARAGSVMDAQAGVIDPEKIRRHGIAPLINLAILDRAGAAAPIGRGFYCPPLTLFERGEPN
jgi:hypothetical protein